MTFGRQLETWVPHEYQHGACETMLKQQAVGLFLDPGLGKTSICLQAFTLLKEANIVHKMLVIAPLRPAYNVWPSEIDKWENFTHLKWCVLHGPDKGAKLRSDADVYIINPEGISWLLDFQRVGRRLHTSDEKLKEIGVDCLCVDESTKFKDSSTNRFKALKRHLSQFKIRWALTGTPIPNGVQDLFGQIYLLDHGRALGQYITHFRSHYMMPHPYNKYQWDLQPGAFERIIDRVKPLIVQLSAEDHLKMPELITNKIEVELPPTAMQIYHEVENEFLALLDQGTILADNSAVAGTKCRQIANGAVYSSLIDGDDEYIRVHDAKLDALDELLEELGEKPVLVMYEYRHDMERIVERLGDKCEVISGASPKKADDMITRFNNGLLNILLGHPASMGHGLNLQGACFNIVWFGITWNLEYYQQANARIYRQGQKSQSVIVHHISAKNTRDERVVQVLGSKDATQRALSSAIAGR